MRFLTLLMILMPLQAMAKAPECPLYPNKYECLTAVEETYKNYMDFLKDEYIDEPQVELFEAANTVRYYENLACQKTCLN